MHEIYEDVCVNFVMKNESVGLGQWIMVQSKVVAWTLLII
jgi:hypothetical protein